MAKSKEDKKDSPKESPKKLARAKRMGYFKMSIPFIVITFIFTWIYSGESPTSPTGSGQDARQTQTQPLVGSNIPPYKKHELAVTNSWSTPVVTNGAPTYFQWSKGAGPNLKIKVSYTTLGGLKTLEIPFDQSIDEAVSKAAGGNDYTVISLAYRTIKPKTTAVVVVHAFDSEQRRSAWKAEQKL